MCAAVAGAAQRIQITNDPLAVMQLLLHEGRRGGIGKEHHRKRAHGHEAEGATTHARTRGVAHCASVYRHGQLAP